jgi:ABC-2 type transport system ATP-binding protein
MTVTIEVDQLRVHYGKMLALDDVTCTLTGDKIYGLLGRNGAGKTTLLSALAAFLPASGGTVRMRDAVDPIEPYLPTDYLLSQTDGQPVFGNPVIARQLCLIRTPCDTLGRFARISAALEFAARMRPNWDADYAAKLLDRFELSPRTRIGALSTGQRSALGVTLGLASRAPVTMFDESHLGMDPSSRYAFYDELLADFAAQPRTVIISTHLVDEMSALFEDILVLDKGRLVLHEPADELRTRGSSITGPAEAVDQFTDRFTDGLTVLGQQRLGRTKSVTVFGVLDDAAREAAAADLDIGPLGLQDLFVHLTQPSRESQ